MENNLPKDFAQILMTQLEEIKKATLLGSKDTLTISECSMLTGLSVKTLYKYTSRRMIPFSKRGKIVFFSKKQVEDWLMAYTVPTNEKIEQQATTYVATHKLQQK